jgi:hypothetical protein
MDDEEEDILLPEVILGDEAGERLSQNQELLKNNRKLTSDDPRSEKENEFGEAIRKEGIGHQEILQEVQVEPEIRQKNSKGPTNEREITSDEKLANPEANMKFKKRNEDDEKPPSADDGSENGRNTERGKNETVRRNPRRKRKIPRKYLE